MAASLWCHREAAFAQARGALWPSCEKSPARVAPAAATRRLGGRRHAGPVSLHGSDGQRKQHRHRCHGDREGAAIATGRHFGDLRLE